MNSTQSTPIQRKDHIQTWTRSIHNRLAVQTKPQGKQSAEISGMQLNIDPIQTNINIPDYMTIQELQKETS